MKLAKAGAAARGRDFATADDVKELAVEALAHRVILKPEAILSGIRPQGVVRELIEQVPTPDLVREGTDGGKADTKQTAQVQTGRPRKAKAGKR
jgi:MoxR-like ATPase